MKIRYPLKEEIPALTDLGEKFFEKTLYAKIGAVYNKEAVAGIFDTLIENNLVIVASDEQKIVGFVMLSVAPLFFSDILSGVELAFYIHPDYRGQGIGHNLIVTAEELLKSKEVHVYSMSALSNSNHDEVGDLYKSMGFIHTESTYSKVI